MTSYMIDVGSSTSTKLIHTGSSVFDFLSIRIGPSFLEIKETSAHFDFGNKRLTNIANPTSDYDVVTRKYATDTFINVSQRGAISGVATLDTVGKIPVTQIPSTISDNFIKNTTCDSLTDITATNLTAAITALAGEVLMGSSSLKITSNGTPQGQVAFTLDAIDPFFIGKPLYIGLKTRALASYTAADMHMILYNATQAAVVASTQVDIPLGDYEAKSWFLVNASVANVVDTYQLYIREKTAPASVGSICVDDPYVSPQINLFGNAIRSANMAGFIQPYAGTTLPAGWLWCDGSDLSITTYSDLYAAIGTTYNTQMNPVTGSNWAAPTGFRVPDYRGTFLRGVGTPNGLDAVTLGGHQVQKTAKNGLGATQPDHTHSVGAGLVDNGPNPWFAVVKGMVDSRAATVYVSPTTGASGGAPAITVAGDNETRPLNKGVNYIIKAYNDQINVQVADMSLVRSLVRYSTNAATTYVDSATTVVDFPIKTMDTKSEVSGSGTDWLFTAKNNGYYQVNVMLTLDTYTGWLADEIFQCHLQKNNAIYSVLWRKAGMITTGASAMNSASGSDLVYLQAGETLRVTIFQNSGTALPFYGDAIYNYINIEQIPFSDGTAAFPIGAQNIIYTEPTMFRNRIINGAMSIDQRNAGTAKTFTAAAALSYCVDRFYGYCTGANVTGQQVVGTLSPYAYQFTGAASVSKIGFAQRIEAANCWDLAGNPAMLSVDLSNSLLTTVTWTMWYANTADTFGTLASPTRTQIATGTFSVSSTTTRCAASVTIPSGATTGIEVEFSVGAQTSGTFKIGRVQLERGVVATPFEVVPAGSLLDACQRYYYVIAATDITSYGNRWNDTLFTIFLPVSMRGSTFVVTSATLYPGGISANGTGTVYGNILRAYCMGTGANPWSGLVTIAGYCDHEL